MTPKGDHSWTSDLIPKINTNSAAQIIAASCDISLVVDASGRITSVNCGPDFSAQEQVKSWNGQQIQETLTIESVPKFEARMSQFNDGAATVTPAEMNHHSTADFAEIPFRYTFHKMEAGEVLMLGTDLRRTAEMQQQLVAAQIALETEYEAQRDHDIRLRVLMDASDVATVFVAASSGRILQSNSTAEILFGKSKSALTNASFADEFAASDRKSVLDGLVSAASNQTHAPIVAKALSGKENLSIVPTMFRGATSQTILCRIMPVGSERPAAGQLQNQLSDLFQNGMDSFVFVSEAGTILSANEAFLKLANVTHSQNIVGRPFAEFCSRGSVDMNVMVENAKRSGGMRIYATKISGEHGGERAVEISTTMLKAGASPIFALIIRDSHRLDTAATPSRQITDVDMHSVIELIGAQSLKDIVAKTTDVVEKICIETAVQMTSNNRVAAAEMLGLSRQSLYVKLRKYDLLEKD